MITGSNEADLEIRIQNRSRKRLLAKGKDRARSVNIPTPRRENEQRSEGSGVIAFLSKLKHSNILKTNKKINNKISLAISGFFC
jgi:hypothetical protein